MANRLRSSFNYQVVKYLGQGTFGATFEAVETGTNDRVALKFIFPTSAAMEEGAFEVRAYQKVAASDIADQCFPTLLCFHDAGELLPSDPEYGSIFAQLAQKYKGRDQLQQGTPLVYIVTDFLEGSDVDKISRSPNKKLTDAEVKRFLYDTLTALRELHSRGLAHRDVKPANIMRTDNGRYVLIDFGLVCGSRFCSPSGTILYLPNEILMIGDADGKVPLNMSMAGDFFGLALSLHDYIYEDFREGTRVGSIYRGTELPQVDTVSATINKVYQILLLDYNQLAVYPKYVDQLIDMVSPTRRIVF